MKAARTEQAGAQGRVGRRVVIVGGGITGLTCAHQLARSGHEVTVYEKGQSMGGLASSYHMDEAVFDYGPHEFCTENPVLVEALKEILGQDLLVRQKTAAQHFGGKYVDYPLSPVQVLAQLSPVLITRVFLEVVLQRLKTLVWSSNDYSFEKWVVSRFGRTLYRTYFGPYTRKVWGIDPDRLDPRTASSRISFNSIFDYIIKTTAYFLFKRDDYSSIHSPLKNSYYYARGGIGTLTQRLAERCVEAGVKFEFDHGLERLESEGDVVQALHFENGQSVRDFDYVVSTIPVTGLLACMGHPVIGLPVRFRSMVFVFMVIPKEKMSPYSWIYFPDEDVIFQRTTEFSHLDADMTPPGKTGVCFEISCFPDDPFWKMSDARIVGRVRADLEKVGLLERSVACEVHVVRKKFIYPIQVVGYLEGIHALMTPVRKLKNAVSTGRQGLYKYCNMNECMEMALEVAEQIEAGTERFRYELDSSWKGAGLESERIARADIARANAAKGDTSQSREEHAGS
jgi:protoporphyrinogen oxidase